MFLKHVHGTKKCAAILFHLVIQQMFLSKVTCDSDLLWDVHMMEQVGVRHIAQGCRQVDRADIGV